MNSKRKVIAVCGSSSGVGKTTLVNHLVSVIPNSRAFFFDSYESTTIYPENMFQKLVTGEEINPEDIRNNEFYEDLLKLSFGGSVIDPMNRVIKSADYLIVEEPFGNLRFGMKELIDYVICIDLPFDIALARRLVRNYRENFTDLSYEERETLIMEYLEQYLHGGRIGYKKVFNWVAGCSDLMINGMKSTEEQGEDVLNALQNAKLLR
ncbi:uridine kinase [Natronobacillus azotifigens]|uniref:Uridine kinase n=1 Tax=Natronobacillus azotifigens TaxID=472978 RepID=A0A9J6RBJ2_9BACI|nr:hypothetical protein [Natronobacillus azotifigens]MCZ0702911.1 hypothetical protein [Natronobacillus azotifigens]